MNDAHLHIALNHFPIIGLIIGTLILIAGIIFKSIVTRKVAFTVLLFSCVFGFMTFGSGEDAEEVIEHMPTTTKETHHLIHEHEEKAGIVMPFIWGICILSLISLFLEWKKKKVAVYFTLITLVVSIIACYFMKDIATSGGEISHPEIRSDFKFSEHEEHH